MKYAWLTKIRHGSSDATYDTLMMLPFEDEVIAILHGIAQATHYAGTSSEWWHKKLCWYNNSAYDATDKSYSKPLYQIRFIYTPDDGELEFMPDYRGVR